MDIILTQEHWRKSWKNDILLDWPLSGVVIKIKLEMQRFWDWQWNNVIIKTSGRVACDYCSTIRLMVHNTNNTRHFKWSWLLHSYRFGERAHERTDEQTVPQNLDCILYCAPLLWTVCEGSKGTLSKFLIQSKDPAAHSPPPFVAFNSLVNKVDCANGKSHPEAL